MSTAAENEKDDMDASKAPLMDHLIELRQRLMYSVGGLIIGAVPGVRGAYMNCGHNCWGILWAPISGKVVSELVADGKAASVDLTHFAPGRFMTAAQKRGRKMRDVNVGEQW